MIDLAAFDLRWEGFDDCQFNQIVFHAVKHFHTDLLVGHLTTAETQRDSWPYRHLRESESGCGVLPDSHLHQYQGRIQFP